MAERKIDLIDWDFWLSVASRVPWERILIRKTDKDIARLEEKLKSIAPSVESSTVALPSGRRVELPATQEAPIEPAPSNGDIATACLACAVGHFSTSSGLLKEALRFKNEGIASDEILNRIATCLEEQNALEREDITPEKIQRLPEWERQIAEEALVRSRQLRHKLEAIQTIEDLEQLAADTRTYYLTLSRQWYKGRFSNAGDKADLIAQKVGEK